ncbi:Programmed cell death protein 10 [Clonorchis sinensis]|uniref:Programmed cell death protein 10 n=1 Tax=Clonorchis sinensis TaxID=79923 RepID=A0A8T1MDN3_CLOSI|nr:Programmed cell death protein 10 [Clonorchis sinensis]
MPQPCVMVSAALSRFVHTFCSVQQADRISNTNAMCTEIKVPMEVLTSTFRTLRREDSRRTALLQQAFCNVEAEYPGFSTYFTSGLLQRLGFFEDASTAESLLRLCVLQEPTTHQVPIPYHSLRCFLVDTFSLRSTLVRIPETIRERQAFIVIIRDVATTLRKFLDSSSVIFSVLEEVQRSVLKELFRELMVLCREFSSHLKIYFTTEDEDVVFQSAIALVHHIDLIIKALCQTD